ncbi:MAG: hypothetical protein V1903_14235 [Bacteroidota bacterium]
MENTEKKERSSKPVSLLLLIPSLLFGLIALAMSIVGLGLIPILPAVIGLLLGMFSFFFFRQSYRVFTWIVLGILVLSVLISIVRGTLIENKVAADKNFETTIQQTQENVEADLQDAFDDIDFEAETEGDSLATQ